MTGSELRINESGRDTELMYRLVAWVSGLTIIATVMYGMISSLLTSGGVVEIGETLVNVEFPLPYFAKPVTYLGFASVTFFYSTLALCQNRLARWSQLRLSIIHLIALVVAFGSAYEVLYNFMLWGAIYSVQVLQENMKNPDFITSPSPVPWNLVFATRMFAVIFVISGYTMYFLRRIQRKVMLDSKAQSRVPSEGHKLSAGRYDSFAIATIP